MSGVNFFGGDFRMRTGARRGTIVAPAPVVYDLRGEGDLDGQGWVPVTLEQMACILMCKTWEFDIGGGVSWSSNDVIVLPRTFTIPLPVTLPACAGGSGSYKIAANSFAASITTAAGRVVSQVWGDPENYGRLYVEDVYEAKTGEFSEYDKLSMVVCCRLSFGVALSGGFFCRWAGELGFFGWSNSLLTEYPHQEVTQSYYLISAPWEEGMMCATTQDDPDLEDGDQDNIMWVEVPSVRWDITVNCGAAGELRLPVGTVDSQCSVENLSAVWFEHIVPGPTGSIGGAQFAPGTAPVLTGVTFTAGESW